MLKTLTINHFRNLSKNELVLRPQFNFFYGANGAGKTNLLEAIYYLANGRSFRTHLLQHILEYNQDEFLLCAKVVSQNKELALGIERKRDGSSNVHLAGEKINGFSELAQILPLQLFNQDSFALLEAGPSARRQFLDWGVFHVEQNFYVYWKKARRIIEQRNAALRRSATDAQIILWNQELSSVAEQLDQWRKNYLQQLLPLAFSFLELLLPIGVDDIEYYRGWPKDKSLNEVLDANLERDRHFKFTQFGPQRAELYFKIDNRAVADVLSRGQIKLFIFALRLAQARLLQQHNGKQALFLIDDLPAELDCGKRKLLIKVLQDFGAQIFITSADLNSLEAMFKNTERNCWHLFHVEQGKITKQ